MQPASGSPVANLPLPAARLEEEVQSDLRSSDRVATPRPVLRMAPWLNALGHCLRCLTILNKKSHMLTYLAVSPGNYVASPGWRWELWSGLWFVARAQSFLSTIFSAAVTGSARLPTSQWEQLAPEEDPGFRPSSSSLPPSNRLLRPVVVIS